MAKQLLEARDGGLARQLGPFVRLDQSPEQLGEQVVLRGEVGVRGGGRHAGTLRHHADRQLVVAHLVQQLRRLGEQALDRLHLSRIEALAGQCGHLTRHVFRVCPRPLPGQWSLTRSVSGREQRKRPTGLELESRALAEAGDRHLVRLGRRGLAFDDLEATPAGIRCDLRVEVRGHPPHQGP